MNIASVIDVEAIKAYAAGLGDVVFSTNSLYTCSDTTLGEIRDIIHENRLNRVVVASCSPRTHEPLFRETLREAGLNPYLFELANIRDQASWVHADNPEAATEKAKDLVRMAVARAKLLRPLKKSTLEVNQSGLVIGGGLSGMTAALALADQGFLTHLVERAETLGGNLRDLKYTLEHDNVATFADDLIRRVENHDRIRVYKAMDVAKVAGHVGNFHITLADTEGQEKDVSCGAIIVATGAGAAETTEFLHGQNAGVLTQQELEDQLHAGSFPAQGQSVVMIQCVGSRNDEHPYCSRMCCSMAVKNALRLKKNDSQAKVYVLYRDLRTYGYREKYYKAAREAGVIFIRYDRDKPPVVADGKALKVAVDSPDLPGTLEIMADNVILSTGVAAEPDNKRVSDLLKVPLNDDGFYVEAHMKLRPVDFATEGVFLCGLAHSPKFIDENIAQARAAASRASTILSKTHLDVDAQVSQVDQTKCISCMTCVHVCPYNAPYMNYDHKGQIEAAKCMGCGICASECPACAIQLNHCENQQFTAMIEELFSSETLS
jgi:heterodisulfide reductase subunit A2